jgi:hypothetical protein
MADMLIAMRSAQKFPTKKETIMKNLIYKLRAREGAGAFLAWCNIATAVDDADLRDVSRLDRFAVLFPGRGAVVFTPAPSEVALRWMEITSAGRLAPRRPGARPDWATGNDEILHTDIDMWEAAAHAAFNRVKIEGTPNVLL